MSRDEHEKGPEVQLNFKEKLGFNRAEKSQGIW